MVPAGDLLKAAVRAHRAGSSEEAAFLYQQVLSLRPENVDALCNLGLIRQQEKKLDQAERLLRKAIAADPKSVDAYLNLTNVLNLQRKFDEAIGLCEKALKFSRRNRLLLNNLATNLHGAGRHTEAISLLRDLIAAHPGYAQGSYNIAKILEETGNAAAAVGFYEQAARLSPGDGIALIAAGECLLKNGKTADALTMFDRARVRNAFDVRALALTSLAYAELDRRDEERWLADPDRLARIHRLQELGLDAREVADFNRTLSEFASNHPSMQQDPPGNATYNGWHSGNLAYEGNAAVEKFKKFIAYALDRRIKSLAEESSDHPLSQRIPEDFDLNLWAVKMTAGGKMIPHIHPDGWLSGVYYVDVPSVVNDPDAQEAGWIKFGSPRNDIRLTRKTLTRTVKPEPGLLVTFPSYIWHDTIPLPADNTEQRLCLSFDLQPKPVA